jgi:peptidoglycan/xylan/chitin deacetylase (PgdA/CDA1 family)
MYFLRSCGAALAATVLTACAFEHDHAHDPEAVSAAFEHAWEERVDEGKSDIPGCSGVRVPDRGPLGMRVALTFDDGPSAATTPSVLATLRERAIPATFFINGVRVVDDETRAIVEEIVEDPLFELGNHSWSHPDLTTLDPASVASQIDRTTTVIEAAGGEPRYFRFPFGSSSCVTAGAARERGYRITGWHIDSADWCFSTNGGVCPERVFQYVPDAYREDMKAFVLEQAERNGGGILLFHDIHRHTALSLEGIIGALEDAGFTFTSLDDLTTFPLLNGIVPPSVGDACDEDEDCVLLDGGFCHREGFCTTGCEGYCADGATVKTFCVQDGDAQAGICVPQAAPDTECAAFPYASAVALERWIGESSASPKMAQVCAPEL